MQSELELKKEKLKYARLVIDYQLAIEKGEEPTKGGRKRISLSKGFAIEKEFEPRFIAQRNKIRDSGGSVIDAALMVTIQAHGDIISQERLIIESLEMQFPGATKLGFVKRTDMEDSAELILFSDKKILTGALKTINKHINSPILIKETMSELMEEKSHQIADIVDKDEALSFMNEYAVRNHSSLDESGLKIC